MEVVDHGFRTCALGVRVGADGLDALPRYRFPGRPDGDSSQDRCSASGALVLSKVMARTGGALSTLEVARESKDPAIPRKSIHTSLQMTITGRPI